MPQATKADVDNAARRVEAEIAALQKALDVGLRETKGDLAAARRRQQAVRSKLIRLEEDTKVVRQAADFQAATDLLDLVSRSVGSLIAAVQAGEDDDPFGVATNTLASVSAMFMFAAGGALVAGQIEFAIAFAVVAGMIDLAETITEALAPRERRLMEQIEQLLRKHRSEELGGVLDAAFQDVTEVLHTFADEEGSWEARPWKDYADHMTASLTVATNAMNQVTSWLKVTKNQNLGPYWTEVLELWVQCHFELYLTKMFAFAHSHQRALSVMQKGTFQGQTREELIKSEHDAVGAFERHLTVLEEGLDQLLWPARNMSQLFSLGNGNQRIYSTGGCIIPPELRESVVEEDKSKAQPFKWRYLNGVHDDLMVLPRHDASPTAQILAWKADGDNFEIYLDSSKDDDWHPALPNVGSRHASFDVSAIGVDRVACVVAPPGTPRVRVLAIDVLRREADKLTYPPVKRQVIPLAVRVDGVPRGFTSIASNPAEPPLFHVAFRDATNQVWVAHAATETADKIGVPADWCTQVFGRDGFVWAIGGHRVARLPWDAAPTAQWEDVSPDPKKLGLTGSWEIIYLDPPGPEGLMVATLKHQLLFWTEEEGWQKGQEGGDIAFNLVRLAPEPVCRQLVSLRNASVASKDSLAKLKIT